MKKIFYLITAAGILLCGCEKKEEQGPGSIYGVVTVASASAEPMRGTGVELYDDNWNLMLRTTTYDDGHYEFNDLQAATYWLKVSAEGYEETQYHVVVEAGRTARADMQLKKNISTRVLTLAATNIGGNFATLNGQYLDSVNNVGFIYATHSNPSNGGTRVKANINYIFSTRVTNLTTGTYYVQAYAIWNNETSFGEVHSFQIKGEPVIITLAATNVETNTATLNGKIEYAGDPPYTERGFVYSGSFENPTVEDDASTTTKRIVSGTSTEFSANVSGLTSEQTYYVRAYVTNSDGTVYGEQATVTATPNEHYTFVNWTEDGVEVENAAAEYTFTVTGNRTLVANFTEDGNGIANNTLANVTVYSSGNTVYIVNKNSVNLKLIQITDVLGRVVYSGKASSSVAIPVNGASGIYIVRIVSDDNKTSSTKVHLTR